MTAPTPNAELAYRVLDHIDAHPEEWHQGVYIGKTDCGTVACFAGRAILLSLPEHRLRFEESGRRLSIGRILREAGSVIDDDDRLTSARVMAEKLLGAHSWVHEGEEDEEDLFDQNNTREDLGRLVEEIFGPRPGVPVPGIPPSGCDCSHDGGEGLAPWPDRSRGHADDCPASPKYGDGAGSAWRSCAHRADYSSAAHHERECPFHNGEVDENGLPVDDVPPNAGSAS